MCYEYMSSLNSWVLFYVVMLLIFVILLIYIYILSSAFSPIVTFRLSCIHSAAASMRLLGFHALDIARRLQKKEEKK